MKIASATSKPFDVVGFGVSSIDHLCLVPRHPRLDSKQPLVQYDVQPGGQVPTALVALQRWGLRTAYIGCFGDDIGGVKAQSALAIDGVDVEGTFQRRNVQQQVSVILIDEVTGERSVLWQRAPDLILRPDELDRESLTRGRVLLMDAVDIPAAIRAARWARDAGVLTVLDIDMAAPGIDELLTLTDVLIVGAEFPERLTGLSDLRAALRATAKRGPWFTGATLGPGGALAVVHSALHYVEAYRVPVLDSTGAGDLFHAGCIYGLLQAWPVAEILRFASAAAALKCRRLGGRPGIPTAREAAELAGIADRR